MRRPSRGGVPGARASFDLLPSHLAEWQGGRARLELMTLVTRAHNRTDSPRILSRIRLGVLNLPGPVGYDERSANVTVSLAVPVT